MKWRALALAALLGSCAEDHAPSGDGGVISGDGGPVDATVLPAACVGAPTPATSLACTGLYADIATKAIAVEVRAYSPAVPLWSDGAEKHRWFSLPPGTTIDTSKPGEWSFPVGTKFWKEFVKEGRRVETRLWQKVSPTLWVNATYAWNQDETAATKSPGGDIPLGSGTYHIPTNDECEKCHRGHSDRILGFEQVELSLPGAGGVTMADLVKEGRVSRPPATASLQIGDDGTGAAAPALGWLHANCGLTCHNSNPNATAFSAGMILRLDPTTLDGRSLAGADALRTTVNVRVNNPNWSGRTRIVPGQPGSSLLYQLISYRGDGNQMPPIASRVVDQAGIALVSNWIQKMSGAPSGDGGAPDAARPDSAPIDSANPDVPAMDAALADAGAPDTPSADVGSADAALPDAGTDTFTDTPVIADAAADSGVAPPIDAAAVDRPPSTLSQSLVLRWAFDEESGTQVADLSGHGLDGVAVSAVDAGPPPPTTSVPPVLFGDPRSRQFDAQARQAVQRVDLSPVLRPAAVTMAVWYRTTSVYADFGQLISAGDDYGLKIGSSNLIVEHRVAGGWATCKPSFIGHLDGAWHHLSATIDASGQAIFFDGRPISRCSTTAGAIVYDQGSSFWVGRHGNGGETADFQGYLDDVRVYQRVLTDAEIQALASGRD